MIVAFRDLIVSLSGLPDDRVLRAYGDGGRPQDSHMTVLATTDARRGFPGERKTTAQDVSQHRNQSVQIDAYGQTAVDALHNVALLLESDDKRVTDIAPTLVMRSVGDVIDTTTPYQAKYEPRATLDVVVGYVKTVTTATPQGAAEQIDLTITSQESSATLTDVVDTL